MKTLFAIVSLCLSLSIANAQQAATPTTNAELAQKYGADDYGMKMYVLVILKTGSNTSATKAQTDSLFSGHMQNINRLADEGKLIVAGPLGKNQLSYRGIFIFDTKSIDEAKKWVATDPAVNGKLLDAEFLNWYGSAALPAYLEVDKQLPKKGF